MASKNLCGTCLYWGTKEENHEKFRQCTRIYHDDHGYTGEDEEAYMDYEPKEIKDWRETRNQKAVVVDGSGYFAALRCRSDFGCVYYKQRENMEKKEWK